MNYLTYFLKQIQAFRKKGLQNPDGSMVKINHVEATRETLIRLVLATHNQMLGVGINEDLETKLLWVLDAKVGDLWGKLLGCDVYIGGESMPASDYGLVFYYKIEGRLTYAGFNGFLKIETTNLDSAYGHRPRA